MLIDESKENVFVLQSSYNVQNLKYRNKAKTLGKERKNIVLHKVISSSIEILDQEGQKFDFVISRGNPLIRLVGVL